MTSQQISLQPAARPVTCEWLTPRRAYWSWEVRHSEVSWSCGVHALEQVARDAIVEALKSRGGHALLQLCTLVMDQEAGPNVLRTTYGYGRVISRAYVDRGVVTWRIGDAHY